MRSWSMTSFIITAQFFIFHLYSICGDNLKTTMSNLFSKAFNNASLSEEKKLNHTLRHRTTILEHFHEKKKHLELEQMVQLFAFPKFK